MNQPHDVTHINTPGDEEEDEREEDVSSSSDGEHSDDEDVFNIRRVTVMSTNEEYQSSFLCRWWKAVEEMQSQLRDGVLLPLDPRKFSGDNVFCEVETAFV